jgi:hypothetical protein
VLVVLHDDRGSLLIGSDQLHACVIGPRIPRWEAAAAAVSLPFVPAPVFAILRDPPAVSAGSRLGAQVLVGGSGRLGR